MQQYNVTLYGLTPLLMHQDNLAFGEKIKLWQRDPANKEHSVSGDDRSPAWTWLGYLYHDGKHVGMPSDNLMTALREGGAKLLTGKGKETYKRQTQSGVIIDQQQFILHNGSGDTIPLQPLNALIGNNDFAAHLQAAEDLGFELLVKRAKIGQSKHVRVRPMFRQWSLVGSITVLDEELSGLTQDVLARILELSGALCGLGDWRPSSPRAGGSFGKFEVEVSRR